MSAEITPGILPLDTLFIHGNLASNRWWEPSLRLWKKNADGKFMEGRALAVEWRGCGKSRIPQSEAELTIPVLAQDYIDFLDSKGFKKVNLVGHSTGCLIALQAAAMRPELFHRILLLDPVGAEGFKFEQASYDAFTQMSKDFDFCKLVMAATVHKADVTDTFFLELVRDAFAVAQPVWHGIPNVLAKTNITDLLPTIKHPVLVLHGDQDAILQAEPARRLAENLPNGQFELLPDQGHSCNVENPVLFVKKANAFLFEESIA